MRLYRSQTHDPFQNLALEQALLRSGETAAFLWVNRPCVVIGRNQNPYREADLDYLRANDIALARRATGGGAVYHDLQNLNYSYICDDPDEGTILDIACQALQSLGAAVERRGRNDLMLGDRKIGGFAHLFDRRYLCHGTIMVDVNLQQMERALAPSKLKLESHGVESVRSRVANLRDSVPDVSVDDVMRAFERVMETTALPLPTTEDMQREAQRLKSDEWVFGATPRYDAIVERRLPDGLYQFELHVRNGIIVDAAVYTDSLMTLDTEPMRRHLQGKPFDPRTFDAVC